MSDVELSDAGAGATEGAAERGSGWLALGGLTGAVLASACCVGPLVLVTLGVTGAWIGNLAVLEPYQPIFAGAALVLLGLGFRRVYFRARPACATGSICARPHSSAITRAALWLGTVLVAVALTVPWWVPLLY